ncbi:MAG: hypothetical protein GY737_08225 [Desulfobacteraceae bacterium]|nr:hypothetical protein [Desulfobacteraceae bacterium]
MKNQHEKIKGYRDLSQQEVDLMNEIKAKGEELGALMNNLTHGLYNSGHGADYIAEGARWQAIAKTHLQQGIMAAVRAVAQPTTF